MCGRVVFWLLVGRLPMVRRLGIPFMLVMKGGEGRGVSGSSCV